jgi:streptogramin lyase
MGVLKCKTAVSVLLAMASAGAAEIKTIAGTGKAGHSEDGVPANASELNNPYGITVGPDGLYFCEVDNNVVRRLDLKTGKLWTVAGNGQKGYSGDGGPALAASLNQPY